MHKIVTRFLALPPTLKDHVLSFLDARDLLNLRHTSHALHNSVHESASALCATFSRELIGMYNIHPEAIPITDLTGLVRAERKYQAMLGVAKAMADRLSWSLKSRPHLSSAAVLKAWQERTATKLAHKITGTLFYLSFYVDFVRETVLNHEEVFSPLHDKEYAQLSNIFDFDQQDFLDQNMYWLHEYDFIDVSCVLRLFAGVCQGRRIPLRQKPHAHSPASIRQILIYHGLEPFARLLAPETTLWDQTAILREYSEKIASWTRHGIKTPHRNDRCQNIHSLIPKGEAQEIGLDPNRTSQARDLFVANQDIWDRSARAHMLRKNGKLPEHWGPIDWLIAQARERNDSPRDEIMVGHWDQPNRR